MSRGARKRTATEEALVSMWASVRSSATHFERRELPPPGQPVRQFLHGLSLPFHLIRALRADQVAWRRYLRVAILQSLVTLALGLTFMRSADEAVDAAQESAERTVRAEEARELERERFKLEVKHAAQEVAREALALSGVEAAPAPDEAEQHRVADEAGQRPAPTPPEEATVQRPRIKGLVVTRLEFWVALLATMQIAQWMVIALSRDFHDVISRDASLLTGVEPEDGEISPRIWLDLQWVRKKFSRRIRAFTVFMSGLPVLFMITAPLPHRSEMLTVLVPAWSAYWLVVFTAGKSARAWDNTEPREPWFLRGWKWLTTRVPGFRWGFLQRYSLFWTNRTVSVFAPASEVEKLPWAFAGLAAMKALAILPIVKCFLRPLFPVASTHLLVAQRAASATPPSEAPAPPAASSATAA